MLTIELLPVWAAAPIFRSSVVNIFCFSKEIPGKNKNS